MMCDYMRFGGCRVDPRARNGSPPRAKSSTSFPRFLDEFEKLITTTKSSSRARRRSGNSPPSWRSTPASPARCLRASGVNYDIRKVDGYGIYPRFKFRVPLGDHGDCYDRLMMRVARNAREPDDSAPGDRRNFPRARSKIRR